MCENHCAVGVAKEKDLSDVIRQREVARQAQEANIRAARRAEQEKSQTTIKGFRSCTAEQTTAIVETATKPKPAAAPQPEPAKKSMPLPKPEATAKPSGEVLVQPKAKPAPKSTGLSELKTKVEDENYKQFLLNSLRDIKSKEQVFRRGGRRGEKIRFVRRALIKLKDDLGISEYLNLRNPREIAETANMIKEELMKHGIEDFPRCLSERFL